MRVVSFKTARSRSFRRLLDWFGIILSFAFNTFLDWLTRRDSLERRAVRLRHAFERKGGAFIKLGIHLSTRADFIPWIYCNELSSMVDRMEPFPTQDAIATIERSTQRPLSASFREFDPEPILSTSVACLYQAILHSGDKVIVKVRRPGIGEQFMADFQAFDWLVRLAEFLTIFRPGFTKGMRSEFRELLLEELDFINEARRQDAFRRSAKDSRVTFFSSPRIYLGLSGEEVVVSEFVTGIWLWELLAAVENKNEAVLNRAREMNIDSNKVAKHLLWVNYWAWDINLFFHADPNPNNIIVCSDSSLFFINFASTGYLNRSKRQALRQILSYAWKNDPQNMARAALVLLEPLPPVDLIDLTMELETYNWELIYAQAATGSSLKWQERTSAVIWLGMIRLARKYGILLDLQVLRLIRATLLYESVAVRLNPNIDFVRQYHKFTRYRAEQARRRVTDSIQDQLNPNKNERLIVRLDRFAYTAESLLFRARHSLALPTVNFHTMIGKWSFAFYILFRFFAYLFILTGLAYLLNSIFMYQGIQSQNFNDILHTTITNPLYLAAVFLLIFITGRTVLFRFDDIDTA